MFICPFAQHFSIAMFIVVVILKHRSICAMFLRFIFNSNKKCGMAQNVGSRLHPLLFLFFLILFGCSLFAVSVVYKASSARIQKRKEFCLHLSSCTRYINTKMHIVPMYVYLYIEQRTQAYTCVNQPFLQIIENEHIICILGIYATGRVHR